MVIASILFTISVLLVIFADRLFAFARRNRDAAFLSRTQIVATPLFWTAMGGACLAMSIIEMRMGIIQGVRIGVIPRAEHPIWFWGITGGICLASLVIVFLGFGDFARAWRDTSRQMNGADDRT